MLTDLLLSASIIVFAGGFAFLTTRRWDVSPAPFMVVAAVLILVGLSTQLAASPFYLGLFDGPYYLEWAFAISEAWRDGQPWSGRVIWPGKGVWPLMIAVVNYSFGPVLVAVIVINALVFAFSIVLLQQTTVLLFDVRPKWTIIALALTSSPVLLNAPTVLREAIFWFGISAGILAITYLYRASFARGVAFLLLSALVVLGIRPNLGVVIAYLLVAAAIAIWALRRESMSISRMFVGSTLFAVLCATFFPTFFALTAIGDIEERVSIVATLLATGGGVTTALGESSEVSELPGFVCDSASYVRLFCDSLARLPFLMFGPFLWEIGPEPVWILVVTSTLHFLFLLTTSVLLLLKKSNRNIASLSLLGLSLATMVVLAAVMTNYGIIIRFRVVAELFLLPLSLAFILGLRGDGLGIFHLGQIRDIGRGRAKRRAEVIISGCAS